jgi:CDP-glycerol glycerophosphotransferase (TagB/SpsB family)
MPALYFLVYRDRPLKELFDRYSPDIVLVSSVYNRFDRRVLPEAVVRGIPTAGLSAGWDHLDKYYLPFHVDKFLAASEQMKRSAIAFQRYRPDEISVVGYPQYDFLVDQCFIRPRADILAHMGFPPNARYIMYVSGSAYCPDEPDIIAEILSWIERGDFGDNTYLVIRPYLGSRGRDKAFDVAKFNRFKEHRRVFFYDMKLPNYLDELTLFVNILRHAHAVMAVYSTALLEAAILGRPIVAAPFDGHTRRPFYRSIKRFRGFEHFQDVIRFGALKEAFNFPELRNILARYLEDPSLDADKRARMCAELCYQLDGKASQRVADALLGLL